MQSSSIIDFGQTTQSKQLKAGGGELVNLVVCNINTAAAWVHVYDKATAPVLGTDVPKWRIPVNPGVASPAQWGIGALPLHATFRFSAGCWIVATTSPDHTVTTKPTSDLVANWTVN